MTPLWMTGLEDGELEGLFCQVTREITQTAAQAGCRVLQGLDLLPHQPRFFTDSAHPNDLGHTQLALGLLSELKRG